MSYHSKSRWILIPLGLLVVACASGEAVPADYGAGPNGTDKPPASQQGESTPVPNFAGCNNVDEADEAGSFSACSNACYQCISEADDSGDDGGVEMLECIYGAACQAFIAQYIDFVKDDGLDADENILLAPDAPPIQPGNDCEDLTDDPCGLCICEEQQLSACAEVCSG